MNERKRFCTECGEHLQTYNSFCSNCGQHAENEGKDVKKAMYDNRSVYNVTKGQMTTIWMFTVVLMLVLFVNVADSYEPSLAAQMLLVITPAATIFYTIGWRNKQ